MANKTFSSWSQIEAFLKKHIDDALNKEVAQHVKEEIQTSVSDTVYAAGEPEVYQRRGGNAYGGMGNSLGTGSLGDPNEMNHTVRDGELSVTNDAEPDRPWWRNLAEAIEFGYADKDTWYSQPRPFMKSATENMKDSGSHVEVMKDALKKRGLDVID